MGPRELTHGTVCDHPLWSLFLTFQFFFFLHTESNFHSCWNSLFSGLKRCWISNNINILWGQRYVVGNRQGQDEEGTARRENPPHSCLHNLSFRKKKYICSHSFSLHLSVIVNLLFWCCNVLNGGMKERARTYEAEHHVVDNHRMFNCQVSG